MTLKELSKSYRISAERLQRRIDTLDEEQKKITNPEQRILMNQRLTTLRTMWREARDIAVLTERYYERGYRRSARYTI
ncbi:MAG: hypothetical protein RR807_08950 [Oscillospiraceae bacterium]